jgi:hypothetical protein
MFDIVMTPTGFGRDAIDGRFARPFTTIELGVRSLTKGAAA